MKNVDNFDHFFTFLKKFSVVSVTSCTCEGSFSKLVLVKSKLRSTIQQDRLNALMMLTVEQDLINIDDIIDDFKTSVS